MSLQLYTHAEQVAAHLRGELLKGRWTGSLPGIVKLGRELGVNHNTIDAALQLLDAEGILVPQGSGRPRLIVLPEGVTKTNALRVAILVYGQVDKSTDYMIQLAHLLGKAGHTAFFAKKTLTELKMQLPRIERLVAETRADAWVICAGSLEVLTWFEKQPLPAFAMFGRRRELKMAGGGPEKPPAFAAVVRRLVELGHRRIVLLAHQERRLPGPGECECAFLAELHVQGIETSSYHMPDWDDSIEGFHRMLDSLFGLTAPTAIISETVDLHSGTQQFLMHRGIRVPQEISLVCTEGASAFDWCRPTLAYIRWDSEPLVQRIVRWAHNVSRGKEDLRQTLIKAEFIEGGTIGPVKE
jgi:DNA-binding LacI/PurR family transcriptional regulator